MLTNYEETEKRMERTMGKRAAGRTGKWRKYMAVTVGIFLGVSALAGIQFLLCRGDACYRECADGRSGVPDAVSSRMVNGECCLDVVANSDTIEDEEEFARTVVQMCRDNSFHSMRLSTDQAGYPCRLEISVYFYREDVNVMEPVFKIYFEPPKSGGGQDEIEKMQYNIFCLLYTSPSPRD